MNTANSMAVSLLHTPQELLVAYRSGSIRNWLSMYCASAMSRGAGAYVSDALVYWPRLHVGLRFTTLTTWAMRLVGTTPSHALTRTRTGVSEVC
jgi:hypothetical protein